MDTQQIAGLMVEMCVRGGHIQAFTGGGGAANILLQPFDGRGNPEGEVTLDKSNAYDLIKTIDNAMTQIASDVADRVRDCLRPTRQWILDALFLPSKTVAPRAQTPAVNPTIDKVFKSLLSGVFRTNCLEVSDL